MVSQIENQFPSLCKFLKKGGGNYDLDMNKLAEIFLKEWENKPYHALAQTPQIFAAFFNCKDTNCFEFAICLRSLADVLDCMLTSSQPGQYGTSRNYTQIKDGSNKNYSEKSLVMAIRKALEQNEKLLQKQMPDEVKNQISQAHSLFQKAEAIIINEKELKKTSLHSATDSFIRLSRAVGLNPTVELISSIAQDLKRMNHELRWISYFTKKAYDNIHWTYESFEAEMEKKDFSGEDDPFLTEDSFKSF